ncbi:MAG: MBL fold metallo-hydrolase, partial [Candidatus Sericytochromatia bacterium]|nr:MBL fold metallo-hydrolase [Candidatus Tanganyikabacteria bacterium]
TRRPHGAWLAALLLATACGAKRPPPVPQGPPQPPWIRKIDPAKPLGRRELAIRWYGTATFVVRTAKATLVIDPFFTREPLSKLLFGKARPRPETWPRLPMPHAILVGHAHYDHFLDGPSLASQTGATLYASDEALRVARAEGTPESLLRPIAGGDRLVAGDMEIEVVESKHSDMATQFLVDGPMAASPAIPMGFLDYKTGTVFDFLIHWRGRTIAHIDSAQIVDENLAGRRADVALLALSGWTWTPKLFERVGKAIEPEALIPMHHDDFFRPYKEGFVEGPVAKLGKAYDGIRAAMPETAILPIDFFQEYRLDAVETP